MTSWPDFFSLVITLSIAGGIIYAILYASKQITQSVATTKENLKGRGLTLSKEGVSVKTNKHFDRSDYVDATQRGFIKAYGASTFGKVNISMEKSSPGPSSNKERKDHDKVH